MDYLDYVIWKGTDAVEEEIKLKMDNILELPLASVEKEIEEIFYLRMAIEFFKTRYDDR